MEPRRARAVVVLAALGFLAAASVALWPERPGAPGGPSGPSDGAVPEDGAAAAPSSLLGSAPPGGRVAASSITGRVRGSWAAPASSEAALRLRIERDGVPLHQSSPAPGPFEAEFPWGERHARAVVELSGFVPRTWLLVEPTTDLGALSFVRAIGYGGRVLDEDDRPLAGAVVELLDHRGRVLGRSAPSGADGRYRVDVDGVPSFVVRARGVLVNHSLQVTHAGALRDGYAALAVGWEGRHDLRFEPGSAVRLRLVDSVRRTPLAGVTVTFHSDVPGPGRAELPPVLAEATSDANGELSVPDRRNLLFLRARGPGVPDHVHLLDTSLFSPPVHELEIGADVLKRVSVRVERAGGAPVGGAGVVVMGRWLDGPPDPDVALDEQRATGEWVLLPGTTGREGLASWTFLVRGREGPLRPASWRVELDDGETREAHWGTFEPVAVPSEGTLPTIRLGDAKLPQDLWVRVTDDGDRALEPYGGTVRLGSAAAGDAPDFYPFEFFPTPGRGVLDGAWQAPLPPPPDLLEAAPAWVDLRLRCRGRSLRRVPVDPSALVRAWRGGTPLDLRFPKASVLGSAVVTDPEGRPAGGALVTLVPADATAVEALAWSLPFPTDGGGRAALADLDPGVPYVAVARDARGAAARHGPWLPSGEVSLRLTAPRGLRVRMLFDAGRPAWPATMSLETEPRGLLPPLSAATGKDGWVTFAGVVPTVHRIEGFARDVERARRLGNADPGMTHRISVAASDVVDGTEIVLPLR